MLLTVSPSILSWRLRHLRQLLLTLRVLLAAHPALHLSLPIVLLPLLLPVPVAYLQTHFQIAYRHALPPEPGTSCPHTHHFRQATGYAAADDAVLDQHGSEADAVVSRGGCGGLCVSEGCGSKCRGSGMDHGADGGVGK